MKENEFDYLDVSDLPAPEPLHQALIAVEALVPGRFLHFHHRQYPRLLFEQLENRNFECDCRLGSDDCCEVFIWAKDDALARQRALSMAFSFTPWNADRAQE